MRPKVSKEEKREHIIGIKVNIITKQKLKFIKNAEQKPLSTLLEPVIEQFIENYAEKNKINWNDWTEELKKGNET